MLILTAIITTIGLIRRRLRSANANQPERQRIPIRTAVANRMRRIRARLDRKLLQPALGAASLIAVALIGSSLVCG